MSFEHVLSDPTSLADLYRAPNDAVLAKATDRFDDGCCDFIAKSTFVMVGTSGADGRLDVSPRGGPAGFVKVLDEHRLVLPDLNGNNRLDSIRNVIASGQIALLFTIPGLGETLRVNGKACITTAPDLLDLFVDELRRPVTAIGVTMESAFIHCAKAFRRGGIWQPETWGDKASAPSPGQMLIDHAEVEGITGEELDEMLQVGYEADLAADLPE